MNVARNIWTKHHSYVSRNLYRKFRFSAINNESTAASQPEVQEEKYDFEDLKVIERTERRKPRIEPFMKNVFTSIFDRELLAYPEIINKEENENLEQRLNTINRVFTDPKKTVEEKKSVLKSTRMYAAPVCWTRNGLAANKTESLTYLEAISKDFQLGQEMSDHWVGLQALQQGLTYDQYNMIIDDLTSGENTIALAIKERVSERITQADFRTEAVMDGQGIWYISGEKVCNYNNGYVLVLCAVEGSRLMAFLVHPKAYGVTAKGAFVNFLKTPVLKLQSQNFSVWDSKTSLKGTPITVSEFLTKARHRVFTAARQHFGVRSCWTAEGRVIILTPDKVRRKIETKSELDNIIQQYPSPLNETEKSSQPAVAVASSSKPGEASKPVKALKSSRRRV